MPYRNGNTAEGIFSSANIDEEQRNLVIVGELVREFTPTLNCIEKFIDGGNHEMAYDFMQRFVKGRQFLMRRKEEIKKIGLWDEKIVTQWEARYGEIVKKYMSVFKITDMPIELKLDE